MGKRFTDSEKWRDKWFRALRPEHKLAWIYFLDNCDHAGVIELDEGLADFQIGTAINWSEFLSIASSRIIELPNGKVFIRKFVEYQYGKLSENCKPHVNVIQRLSHHGIGLDQIYSQEKPKGYAKGMQRVGNTLKEKEQEQEEEQDMETDKEGGAGGNKGKWIIPHEFDCQEVRDLLDAFAKMRSSIKKPIKSLSNTSAILKRFDSKEHLIYALEFCIANEYQGLKTEYRPDNGRGSNPVQRTFEQMKVDNTINAAKRFIENANTNGF